MNLHEYQAKQVLREYGIATPRGAAIDNVSQADGAMVELGGSAWVVKAQIHAGGRGKAGGVKLVRSPEALKEAVNALLGKQLVTYQNAPEGQMVSRSTVRLMYSSRAIGSVSSISRRDTSWPSGAFW